MKELLGICLLLHLAMQITLSLLSPFDIPHNNEKKRKEMKEKKKK